MSYIRISVSYHFSNAFLVTASVRFLHVIFVSFLRHVFNIKSSVQCNTNAVSIWHPEFNAVRYVILDKHDFCLSHSLDILLKHVVFLFLFLFSSNVFVYWKFYEVIWFILILLLHIFANHIPHPFLNWAKRNTSSFSVILDYSFFFSFQYLILVEVLTTIF